MAKERIAKWVFDQATSILSLFDARVKENPPLKASIDLNEIPGWNDLPEYAKVALQFGIRQGASDPWGAKDLTPSQKLEGMASDLLDYKSATFARAAREKGESISVSKIKEQTWSLADLRYMKNDFFPKMGKTFPPEMAEKLEELEKAAEEHKRTKK